jgi:hypothetical protein
MNGKRCARLGRIVCRDEDARRAASGSVTGRSDFRVRDYLAAIDRWS